ncbi:MAG TPA: hypothetical protein PLV12_07305, partial [Saprospiraceae bacterium]|nr:hypothetical protein [Saprospiraceae bacterium]
MRKSRLLLIIPCVLILFLEALHGQNVAITTNGAAPHTSAMLDIQSTNRGLLVPRLTSSQRLAIASPATGLWVYDLTLSSFAYFDGTVWKVATELNQLTDADKDSKLYIEKNPDEDKLRLDLRGIEALLIERNGSGSHLFHIKNNGFNTFLGNEAGFTTNFTASTPSGRYNTFIGDQTGKANSTGFYNTGVGSAALNGNTLGSYNVAVGGEAMKNNVTGSNNVAIGYNAGGNGSGRVSLGFQAGSQDNTDNKLYIDNSNTNQPLLYGDFTLNQLKVNGQLDIFTLGIENNIMRLLPATASTGDSATLFLAEDNDGSYGMSITYDGASNEMKIFGKSTTNTFGPHLSIARDNGDIKIGDKSRILLYDTTSSTIIIDPAYTPIFSTPRGRIITPELEITGGSDLVEYFPEEVNSEAEPGDLVCISNQGEGNVIKSKHEYDTRIIGVVSGAMGVRSGLMMGQDQKKEVSGSLPIAIAGRVYVKVSDRSEPIKPGDLLTS